MNRNVDPSPQGVMAKAPLTYGYRSDVGRKREHNEDSFVVLNRSELGGALDGLFVVADGMGGMGGGDVASSIVVRTLSEAFHDALGQRSSGARLDAGSLLVDAIVRANEEVQAHRARNSNLRNMGTTCVAAAVQDAQLTLANVGDSRAYLLRDGKLLQLTEDHSSVWEEMQAGRMTREEAQHSRYRNIVTRGVGLAPTISPDIFTHTLKTGDTVLLCSDGLTTEVREADIARILASASEPQKACDRLVDSALQNGGSDNITVIVLRFGPFVPLDLPGFDGDEEEDTDPDADWRHEQARDSGRTLRAADRGEASAIKDLVAQRDAARRRATRLGVATTLLLALIVGEAIGNYFLWKRTQRPAKTTPPIVHKPMLPTDGPLDYAPIPKRIVSGPLREDILLVTPGGNLLVATQNGLLESVTPGGQFGPRVENNVLLPAPAAPGRRPGVRGPIRAMPVARLDLALDASGNRYQILPSLRSVAKYGPTGTLIRSDIGRGHLNAPTKIAIDSSGNIYVIDGRQLKRIDAQSRVAGPVTSEVARPADATTPASAPTDSAH